MTQKWRNVDRDILHILLEGNDGSRVETWHFIKGDRERKKKRESLDIRWRALLRSTHDGNE